MDLPELQEGLQNIEQDAAPSDEISLPPEAGGGETPPEAEAPWELNADSMRDAFGGWYGNDEGLGEMFLTQLRAHGVDTKAATEAMLRELLSGLVNDMNLLQSKLSGFMAELSKQTQQAQAVVDSAQAAIDSSNPDAAALDVQMPSGAMPQFNDLAIDSGMDGGMPPDAGAGAGEMPPEAGGGEMPPDAGAGAGEMPPEAGGGEMPPEAGAGAGEMPPEAGGGEMPPEAGAGAGEMPPENTPSDARIKNVLSDARLKKIKTKLLSNRKPKGNGINSNILAACKRGF